jgi:hypothetical protein
MPDPEDTASPGAADHPTRLQRVARRGCAGLAYAIVLVPLVAVIWFFSTIPRGWEQLGDLAWRIVWEGPPGADTEIVVLNISGHDVQIDMIRFAEHVDHFTQPLEAERENDPNQNIVHYQEIYFREIKPLTFVVEIRYRELDTGVERHASFMADRTPREECKFVVFIEPDGARLSECRRSDLEDFDSP